MFHLKKLKGIASWLVIIALTIMMIPPIQHTQAEYYSENGFLIRDNGDGKTATIVGWAGFRQEHLVIPETIQGFTITIIGKNAFAETQMLQKVTIPNSVVTIEDRAFYDANLEEVILGDNVESIGNYAFFNNKLKTINFGNKLKTIGDRAFQNNQLERLKIPKNLTKINSYTFANNKLTELEIPENITYISWSAFQGNLLTEIEIPENVTGLGTFAFKNNKLTRVTFYNKNINFPTNIQDDPFNGNQDDSKNLTIISFKNSTVEQHANNLGYTFMSFEELGSDFDWINNGDGTATITGYKGNKTEIEIPSKIQGLSVIKIEKDAFQDLAIKLKSVILPKTVEIIGDNAFQDNNLTSVNLESVKEIGVHAFSGNQLTNVTIPNIVTIGDYAFYNNRLTKVVLGNSLLNIGEKAFSQNQLKTIQLPTSLENVYEEAFSNNKINSVEIYNRNANLHSNAFSNNQENPSDLLIFGYTSSTAENHATINGYTFFDLLIKQSIEIEPINSENAKIKKYNGTEFIDTLEIPPFIEGYKITEIGISAFSNPNFKKVIIPDTVTLINNHAFVNLNLIDKNLEEVVFGENVSYIGLNAFYGNNIKRINILNNVKEIKQRAFANNNLEFVKIGTGLSKIESNVFAYNINLKGIEIPNNITEIQLGAFYECGLTEVKLNENLKIIGDQAFYNNNLTEIDIPDSVTTIGKEAFKGIYNSSDGNKLVRVNLGDGITTIGDGAFSFNKIKEITIPASVKTIGNQAFYFNLLEKVTFEEKLVDGVKIGVKTIGQHAFRENNIKELEIPDTVETIDDCAFYGNKFSTVNLGSNVKTIGKYAFSLNWSLQNITLPESVTSVGQYAFSNTGISKVIVLNRYTSFGNYDIFSNGYGSDTITIIGFDPSTAKDYALARGHKFINGEGKVTFSNNGDTEWKKSHSVKIEASGYKENEPPEFAWSTSESAPVSGWNSISGDSMEVTTPNNVTGKYYLHVKGTSILGQSFQSKTDAFYVDNTNPTITLEQDIKEKTFGNVTITVKGYDEHSGVKRIRDPKGIWHNASQITYVVEQNGTYTFVVEDNAGNQNEGQITIKNILNYLDFEVPAISNAISFTLTDTFPTKTLNIGTLKVEDWRTGTNNDWSISVSATPLKMTNGNKSLPVGTIRLRPLKRIQKIDGNGNLPESKINGLTVIDNGSVTIATATGSKGEYEFEFEQQALELWIDPTKVYIDDVINGTKYKTTISWNLITAP